jgi:hypothetical protein
MSQMRANDPEEQKQEGQLILFDVDREQDRRHVADIELGVRQTNEGDPSAVNMTENGLLDQQ